MSRPLCVDLDRTLVRTDILHESMLSLLRSKRLSFATLWWIFRGRAYFKHRICSLGTLDVTKLPYHEDLLTDLKAEYNSGRLIFLSTGADQRVANTVASHLGCFTDVIANDGRTDLVGTEKRKAIQLRFSTSGFDYVGATSDDIPIWMAADAATVVEPSRLLLRRLRHSSILVSRIYNKKQHPLRVVLKAIRIHQWTKNVLLFLPAVLAHKTGEISLAHVGAFFTLSCAASSVYIMNDFLDISSDRKHPTKCTRPLAAGDLSPSDGIRLLVLLFVATVATAAIQPWYFN